jgi:hypothetical protein
MKDRLFAVMYRSAVFVISIVALIMRVFPSGKANYGALLYLTLQTNLVVMLFSGYLAIRSAIDLGKTGRRGSVSYHPRLHGALALLAFFVVIIYWALLSKGKNNLTFVNLALHGFEPLLFIADYLVLVERGHIKKLDPLLFGLLPIAYIAQASFVGLLSGYVFEYKNGLPVHYPYFFMDYERIGLLAAAFIAGIGVVYIGVGFLIALFDRQSIQRKMSLNNHPV